MNCGLTAELDNLGVSTVNEDRLEPSARRLNHMDPDTKLVHCRLEIWGKWSRDADIRAWPEATLLARVIEQGPHGAFSTGKPPIHMPDDIAHVDCAVAKLGEIDRRVIRRYYIEWASTEAMAKVLGMRVREFQNVLRRARWRVSGYLSAIES